MQTNFSRLFFGSTWRCCLILFAVAVAIRATGINWGGFHSDENIGMSVRVLTGEIVPSAHYYPPLLNYLNAVAFVILYGLGRFFGFWWGVDSFRAQYFDDPTPFYIAARLVTASLGALTAPIFFLTAHYIGLSRRLGIFCGLLGAFLASNIVLSHISKSDIAMASFVAATVFAVSLKVREPTDKKADYLIGICTVLAISFKHSAIFFVAPIMLIAIVLMINRSTLNEILLFIFRSGIVFAILWPILNIGIVLDLGNFLEYQKIQTYIAVHDHPFLDGLIRWISISADPIDGIGPIAFVLFLASPLLVHFAGVSGDSRKFLFLVWIAMIVSVLIVISITGIGQKTSLWMPFLSVAMMLAALSIASCISSGSASLRAVGYALAVAAMASSLYGTAVVSAQALQIPNQVRLKQFLVRYLDENDVRILTSTALALRRSKEALRDDQARHERLARKYNVTLPEKAADVRGNPIEKTYYIRSFPWALGGLEFFDETEITTIKPFAWPLQKEEWHLDYWRERGFEIFVVDKEARMLDSVVPSYRQFYEEIRDKCTVIFEAPSLKPLFWEDVTKVYRCEKSR